MQVLHKVDKRALDLARDMHSSELGGIGPRIAEDRLDSRPVDASQDHRHASCQDNVPIAIVLVTGYVDCHAKLRAVRAGENREAG